MSVFYRTEENVINPFKTDKTAENGNHGQCLKWEPQAKCH